MKKIWDFMGSALRMIVVGLVLLGAYFGASGLYENFEVAFGHCTARNHTVQGVYVWTGPNHGKCRH